MLDIKYIRDNKKEVKEGCAQKGIKVDIERLLKLDKERLEYLKKLEDLRAEKNRASKKIAKGSEDKKKIISEMKKVDKKEDNLFRKFSKIEEELNELLFKIPNLPLKEVPRGISEKDNVVLREIGKKPDFKFKPKSYLEISESLDLIDIERAAKVSGTRFGFIKGELVFLQIALINLTFDILTKKGFLPIIAPSMIRPEMMEGTGHLSKLDKKEKYFIKKDNLYLAGSSEQPIVSMHSGETFKEEDLPKRYLGYSTCFRREAGSYGRDTKGIFRVHQFDKIEMFSFCIPEK